MTERPLEYDEAGQDGLVVATLLGEIDWSPQDPLNLPPLNDPRLRLLDAAFAKNPGNTRTLDDWARQLQCSPRTLARLFAKEAGISFQTWRDQVRTFAALPMLAKKKPLAEIADELGYETAWAFSNMFKRVTGLPPSQYRYQ